jgi:hypothetical protein
MTASRRRQQKPIQRFHYTHPSISLYLLYQMGWRSLHFLCDSRRELLCVLKAILAHNTTTTEETGETLQHIKYVEMTDELRALADDDEEEEMDEETIEHGKIMHRLSKIPVEIKRNLRLAKEAVLAMEGDDEADARAYYRKDWYAARYYVYCANEGGSACSHAYFENCNIDSESYVPNAFHAMNKDSLPWTIVTPKACIFEQGARDAHNALIRKHIETLESNGA